MARLAPLDHLHDRPDDQWWAPERANILIKALNPSTEPTQFLLETHPLIDQRLRLLAQIPMLALQALDLILNTKRQSLIARFAAHVTRSQGRDLNAWWRTVILLRLMRGPKSWVNASSVVL